MQTDTVTDWRVWFEADVPCEVEHGKNPCTGEVVAVITACVGRVLSCQSYVDEVSELQEADILHVCGGCKNPIRYCWKVIPV